MVLAMLAFGCSRRAFSADEPAALAENPAQPQLQVAPFQFKPVYGGSLEYTQRGDVINGSRSTYQVLTLAANAGVDVNTFIWQPWFAQVNGGVGLNAYLTDTRYNAGASSQNKNALSNYIVTGKLALDVVPLSRYPFRTFYEKEDNRQNMGFASLNTTDQITRFGINQQYKTLSGQTNYSADYQQNFWENAYFGAAKQKLLGLEMRSLLTPNQDLWITGTRDLNEAMSSNQSTLTNALIATHNFRPSASMTVQNIFNMGRTDIRLPQQQHEDNYTQFTSFTSWLSRERPLTITGNARIAGIDNSSSTNVTTRQSSASASLGANYQQTHEVRTFGNIGFNVADDKNSGTQSMSSYETVGADYISDLTPRGTYNYGQHSSGSFTNTTAYPNSTQIIALSAGHNLNRQKTDSGQVRVTTDLDQTVIANKATRSQPYLNLSHSGSLAWDFGSAEGSTGVRISASDVRAVNGIQNFYQQINLQANRSETMTRNSSLNGDVTIQGSRQGTGGTRTSTTSTNAGINYYQYRVFSVPRLDFSSELRIVGNGLLVTTGPQPPVSRSWTNRLNYSVGRLEALIEGTIAEYNHINQSSLFFRLRRVF
jgi:hypothetical protein